MFVKIKTSTVNELIISHQSPITNHQTGRKDKIFPTFF